MSCRFNSSFRVLASLHQCVRNTLETNKELFLCRRFNTSRKALVRVPQHPLVTANRNERDRSNVFFKKYQIKAVPLPCNFCSKTDEVGAENKKEKISIFKRYKTMFKEYWYVLIPVHIATSCCWLASFYYMAASGMDIPRLLETCGAPQSWVETFKSTEAGNALVALALYKVVTPVRYIVTVGGTTVSIKYLKQWGLIKPVPNKEQLKKIYQEQKDVLKDFKASCQDKMQVTKDKLNKSKPEMKKQIAVAKEMFHSSMRETRYGIREGLRGGAEEWKSISQSFKREIKDSFGSKK